MSDLTHGPIVCNISSLISSTYAMELQFFIMANWWYFQFSICVAISLYMYYFKTDWRRSLDSMSLAIPWCLWLVLDQQRVSSTTSSRSLIWLQSEAGTSTHFSFPQGHLIFHHICLIYNASDGRLSLNFVFNIIIQHTSVCNTSPH